MLSAERETRRGPPICISSADSAEGGADEDEVDGCEVLAVASEAVDVSEYFVLGLICPRAAMFLRSRMDRAAPQSMKAKVAPFHNFILERGVALKLCGRRSNT